MSTKLVRDEENWRQIFQLFDKDGDGIITVGQLIQASDHVNLPKNLRLAITKRREFVTLDEFLYEVNMYQEQNIFMNLLNKWIHFIVPPKHPPMKPRVYQSFAEMK